VLVLVGSLRPAKVDSVRDALDGAASVDPRFRHAEIRTVDLTDIAPRMPVSDQQILGGAYRRALALTRGGQFVPAETLAVGMEGGLHPIPLGEQHIYTLQSWAAVTDGTRWGFGAGGGIALPDVMARRVLGGEELGDIVDELTGERVRGTRGVWGVLTRDLVGRRDAFRLAVLAALAPFYNAAAYGARSEPPSSERGL
jgi:inosine/xanthosine triphosphatase